MSLRVLQQNFRKSTIAETKASRHWDRRLPYMIEHLKKVKPIVVGAQECTVDQCDDIMRAFPNWTYVGGVKFGNSPIFWDTVSMVAVADTLLEKKYPSGTRERYGTLIRLEHDQSDWGGWFGSIHLAANGEDEPDSAHLRAAQMRAIVDDFTAWIQAHPHPEDGKANLIVCGDLNDNLGDNAGVRKIAYDEGGWKPLRKRLPLDKVSGRTLRSFNGWHGTNSLPHDSKPIDEIFTSGITLEDAALRRTCTDVLDLHASDHNGYSADIITS
jgi:hypothetical protein